MTVLADNIRAERARRRWGLRHMSEVTGISKTSLHHIEAGRQEPRIETLRKIAGAFGMTVDEMLKQHQTNQAT